MTISARGELISVGDTVNLTAQFKDQNGNLANTDSFPQISVVSPSGLVLFGPTSAGVMNVSIGIYLFSYVVGVGAALGVYQDLWSGSVNGLRIDQTLSFVVFSSDLPANLSDDGYIALGSDPGFNYSQNAIQNINKIMKAVRARLNSRGKTQITDANGNIQYVDCDIFSVDMLTTFIATSLTDFNQIPYLTYFTFDDTDIINLFFEVLVEGAVLYALASRALIERGNEFQISDNGVSLNIPSVSELLNSQYSQIYTTHLEKLKYIKNSLRPAPRTLGVASTTNSAPSILRRLTTLRARRIF
jgi:hypothetical protein